MHRKSVPGMLLIFFLALASPAIAREKTARATGWVSDENCGAEHTKPGGAGCIRKCMKGGQDIGHPEWKPQRAVFVSDADKKVWIVQNPEAMRGREGEHVKLTGRFDAARNSVRVVEVALAGSQEKEN